MFYLRPSHLKPIKNFSKYTMYCDSTRRTFWTTHFSVEMIKNATNLFYNAVSVKYWNTTLNVSRLYFTLRYLKFSVEDLEFYNNFNPLKSLQCYDEDIYIYIYR